jgi:hypothetical protein
VNTLKTKVFKKSSFINVEMIMTGLTGGNRKKKITADDADYIGKGKCN